MGDPRSEELLPEERRALANAKHLLEHPGFAARLVNALGAPIEKGFARLPVHFHRVVDKATHAALRASLEVAVRSLDPTPPKRPLNFLHRAATGLTGGAGGALGLEALVLELPVTTTLMLRSIAEIARHHGEELELLEARLACLEVFALGGTSAGDDATETGYFAVRTVLAGQIADAVRVLATRGLGESDAPVLLRLLQAIAARFGLVVSEKAAAQLLPIVGGFGGAVINVIFTEHFQNMAEGHFTVRELERRYPPELVRRAYESAGM